jgi:hypothetical protein
MKEGTKQYSVSQKLELLEVGQQFIKKEFINLIWGRTDYFVDRSFDVMFNTAKKQLIGREFRTEKGCIIRIK